MKKYLMTGVAAVALCAAFTSCSNKDEGFATLQDSKQAEYQAKFVSTYGQIASNQDWGFGTTTRSTRAHDVNGNLWYQNWVRPINVGAEVSNEAAVVLAEFSKLRTNQVNTINIDWENYWVQQVYQSTNTYNDANGAATGDIHTKMNKIIAYNEVEVQRTENDQTFTTHYEHVNNFNNGTNTTEYVDDITKEKFIGTTLMKNMGKTPAGTPKFGYHNTLDSKDHFEYIIIPGSQIFPNNPEMHKYYYVGFDFIANDDNAETTFRFRPTGANADIIVNAPLIWKTVSEANEAGVTIKTTVTEWVRDEPESTTNYNGHNETREVEYTVGEGGTWSIDGYQHGNMWVERDWKFNDWIVRISPAEQAGDDDDEVKSQGRIFCEDLGSIGDFDFNDVVFDAKIFESGKIEITVLAAGGTLPITVADVQINNLMGKMVNTGLSSVPVKKINVPAETAKNNGWTTLKSIPVVVTITANQYSEQIMLKSEIGEAPQKICLPIGTKWADEYVDINAAYPNFENWVRGQKGITSPVDVVTPVTDIYVDLDLSNNGEYKK